MLADWMVQVQRQRQGRAAAEGSAVMGGLEQWREKIALA